MTTDAAHTCALCDRSMTRRRLDVTTFGGEPAYIETDEYECLLCDRARLVEDRDRARVEALAWRSTAGVLASCLVMPNTSADEISAALRRYFDLVAAQNQAVEPDSDAT